MDRRGRGRRRAGWSTQANEVVNRVFAYGTFRAGEPARAMIATHVGNTAPGTIRGKIYAFSGGYPGLVDDPGGTVVGEVLELEDITAAFALLDAYEGPEYDRVMKKITLDDGGETWCWVYMLRDPRAIRSGTFIPDGDWVAWRKQHG